MKKLLAVPLLALAVGAGAMGPEGKGPEGEGPMGPGPGMHAPDPAGMKEALGLSEAQVKKLKELSDERKDLKASRRQMRDLMAKLSDQVEDKAGEAELAATLKEIDALQAKLHQAQMALKAERDAVLTVTQRAQLMARRGGRMEERMEKREERREERREKREERRGDK